VDQTELVRELRGLRRGRGVQAVGISGRLGPRLRELCRVTDHDDDHEIRRKLTRTLTSLANRLPPDLRTCFLAAFSLPPEKGLPFYLARLEWAGIQVHREIRTVRRRVDQAIARVAQLAAQRRDASRPGADPGWYTTDLGVSAALTPDGLEVFEFRRIIAERDGLGAISVFWTAGAGDPPLPIDELMVDVLRGGRLADRGLAAANRIHLRVSFPATLNRGQAHDIALRIRTPATWPVAAHYVHVPFQRCDRFQLDFAFKTWPPDAVAILDGILPGDADDQLVPHRPVVTSTDNEIHADFTDLTPYLAFGIRWRPPRQTGRVRTACGAPSSR
jgi:hypothetical protein